MNPILVYLAAVAAGTLALTPVVVLLPRRLAARDRRMGRG